jgi:single-strand DNA-binding protein
MKVAVTGRIQTGSYDDKETGKKVYTTDIVIEEQEFAESKSSQGNAPEPMTGSDGFMSIPDGIDDSLPFN